MKLALIIDDYLPYSTRVGAKMFHELAVELKHRGHQVTVITPDFRYSERFIIDQLDGVTIWRFKSGPIKDVGKISRAINESLLSLKAWMAIQKLVTSDTFDGVIYYSPSIFWGGLVKRIKKRCQCPAYLVLRDLFPQWVIDAGMLRQGSIFERYFRLIENYSYKQADRIGLMSEKNLEIFQVDNKDFPCEVLRNWADITASCCVKNDEQSLREKLNLSNKIIFFYGGNIGHAQDMANLMRLARNMLDHENAHFIFVGQGDEVELINNLAREWNLTNFTYLSSVSQAEFKRILSEVDVGLFSLSARHTAHNFPGKLLGYMVQSLPILGSVNVGNDLLDIVNAHHAGYIHINGEDDKLLESAERLCTDPTLRASMGKNAYVLLEEQFSVVSAAQNVEMRLEAENAVN
jgi:glycosyltransferase involved in cell wall biosynthesis